MNRFLSSLRMGRTTSPSSVSSPRRVRRARLGVESLEGRQLMSGLEPVGSGPITQVYNPPKSAPAAYPGGSTDAAYDLKAEAISGTQINLSWSGGGGESGNYVCGADLRQVDGNRLHQRHVEHLLGNGPATEHELPVQGR